MSTPINPLSKYTTYSYHHILILCANNDVSDALTQVTDVTQFEHQSPQGKYAPKSISNLGEYIVLINSTQDSEFFIDGVSWGSIYTPTGTTDTTQNVNSTELDGEMDIIEPNGMRFVNVMANAARDMKVSVPSMAFLLKTIFVGQLSNGQTEVISGIRPLVFTLVDLKADFNYTGGQYKLSLVGGRDGAAKISGMSHVVGGSTLSIPKGASIADSLRSLQDKANAIYQARMQKINAQRYKARAEATKTANAGNIQEVLSAVDEQFKFQEIRYELNIDPAFEEYLAATNDVESTAGKDGGHTVSFQPDLSIHAAIGRIMETSKQLMEDTSTGVERDGKNRKLTYNIIDRVHKTKDEVIVKIDILQYELTATEEKPGEEGTIGVDVSPPSANVIEFDYVYTGKNVDILEFNMKLDLALAYFQTLQSAQPLDNGQASVTSGTKTDDKEGNVDQIEAVGSNTAFGQIEQSPVFVGPPVQNASKMKANVIETANARNVLATFAQRSTIGVKVKIHGNPTLLEDVLPSITDSTSVPRDTDPSAPTTATFSSDFSKIPGYCKINIKMPARPGSGIQYEPFWFQGYYRIQSVEHSFSGGEFTQELELFSTPLSTEFKDKTSKSGEPPSPTETRTPPADLPIIPRSTSDPADVPSQLFSQYDDLIVAKSLKYNLDPNLMRSLVKAESAFNANAVSPVGAAGLGQLMKPTARAIAKQQEELGILAQPFVMNDTRDDRFDPETNLEFACYLMDQNLTRYKGNTDLALAAYNAGPPAVKAAGNRIPPFKETQDYVKKINRFKALAEITAPVIPPIPVGNNVTKMTPRQMLNKAEGFF